VLDVEHVLLDERGGALRLFHLQGDQLGLRLAPREHQVDGPADHQHAGHHRDDQHRVLGEQAPARQLHSITSLARTSTLLGAATPSRARS
jgi:hypothetical protein